MSPSACNSEELMEKIQASTETREETKDLGNVSIQFQPKNEVFVHSVDSLFGEVIDTTETPLWSDRPPLVLGAKNSKHSLKLLKQKCHLGLPPHLRCAVWISSVVRASNPHQPITMSDSYGTVGMKKILDAGWDCVIKSVFPNPSDSHDAIPHDLGLSQEVLAHLIKSGYAAWKPPTEEESLNGEECPDEGYEAVLQSPSSFSTDSESTSDSIEEVIKSSPPRNRTMKDGIPEGGERSLTRVLCAVHQVLGIEYCPMMPDISAVLLSHMPESYVYATVREMINDTSNFVPICQKDHYSWCKTYKFFLHKMFPQCYKKMKNCGALTPEGLDPIFRRFFTTLLNKEDVLHFMDIFLVEGCKAFFRLALSLASIIPSKELKMLELVDAESWWSEIRKRTKSSQFSFQKHVDKTMYPKLGKVVKRYPRRRVLYRAVKYHQKWALENMPIYIDETPPKPLGFLEEKPVSLAKSAPVRSNLARWLPTSLKSTKLDLIYSTEVHGRCLAALYHECRKTKHTIVLAEALTGETCTTIGMFASQAWKVNPSCYGDVECFLFRASPNAKCFHWVPDFSGNFEDVEKQAVREQFMVAHNDFMAMGANSDGTHGLRLDEYLTKGESHFSLGFENEPLAGDKWIEFDLGVVEVYQLVRELDGKSVDGDDALVWDFEEF